MCVIMLIYRIVAMGTTSIICLGLLEIQAGTEFFGTYWGSPGPAHAVGAVAPVPQGSGDFWHFSGMTWLELAGWLRCALEKGGASRVK